MQYTHTVTDLRVEVLRVIFHALNDQLLVPGSLDVSKVT